MSVDLGSVYLETGVDLQGIKDAQAKIGAEVARWKPLSIPVSVDANALKASLDKALSGLTRSASSAPAVKLGVSVDTAAVQKALNAAVKGSTANAAKLDVVFDTKQIDRALKAAAGPATTTVKADVSFVAGQIDRALRDAVKTATATARVDASFTSTQIQQALRAAIASVTNPPSVKANVAFDPKQMSQALGAAITAIHAGGLPTPTIPAHVSFTASQIQQALRTEAAKVASPLIDAGIKFDAEQIDKALLATTKQASGGLLQVGVRFDPAQVQKALDAAGANLTLNANLNVGKNQQGPLVNPAAQKQALDETEGHVRTFGEHVSDIFNGIRKLGYTVFAGEQILSLGKSIMGFFTNTNAQMETWNAEYIHLLGSASDAQARFQDVQRRAVTTPFTFDELIKFDLQLTAIKADSRDIFTNFVDAAVGMRGRVEDPLTKIANLITQIRGGRINQAMTRTLPSDFGISPEEFRQLGDLSFDGKTYTGTVDQALLTVEKLFKDRWGGIADEQAKTFSGMLSNVKNWSTITTRYLTEPFFDAAKQILGYFGDPQHGLLTKQIFDPTALKPFHDAMIEILRVVGDAIGSFLHLFTNAWGQMEAAFHSGSASALAWGAVLSSLLLTVLAPFNGAITGVVSTFGSMALSMAAFVAPVAPFIALAGAIGLFATQTDEGKKQWGELSTKLDGDRSVFAGIKEDLGAIGGAVKLLVYDFSAGDFSRVFKDLQAIGEAAFLALTSAGQEFFSTLAPAAVKAIGSLFDVFGQLASQAVQWGANLIGGWIDGMMQAMSAFGGALADALFAPFTAIIQAFSPPKRGPLKDIKIWGQHLIDAWLDGMTSADFSVLDTLTTTIKNHLQGLAGVGALDQTALIPRLIGDRQTIESVLSAAATGLMNVDQAAMQLGEALAGEGPQIQAMAEALVHSVDLGRQIEDLKDRQKDLDQEIADKTTEIRDKTLEIKKATEDIKDAQKAEDPYKDQIKGLDEVLSKNTALKDLITASRDLATSAMTERLNQLKDEHDSIQENIDLVKAKYDTELAGLEETKAALEDKIGYEDADLKLRNNQLQLTNAQLSLTDAEKKLADLRSGMDDKGKPLGSPATPLQINQAEIAVNTAQQRLNTAQRNAGPEGTQLVQVDSQIRDLQAQQRGELAPLNAQLQQNSAAQLQQQDLIRKASAPYDAQLKLLRDQKDVLDAEKALLQSHVDLIEASLRPLKDRLDSLNEQKSALDDQKSALDDQKTLLGDQITKLDDQKSAYDDVVKQAQDRLKAEDTTNGLLKDQADLLADLARQDAAKKGPLGFTQPGDLSNQIAPRGQIPIPFELPKPPDLTKMHDDLQPELDKIHQQFVERFDQIGKDIRQGLADKLGDKGTWETVGGTIIGAIAGGMLAGPWGALVGAGLGAGILPKLLETLADSAKWIAGLGALAGVFTTVFPELVAGWISGGLALLLPDALGGVIGSLGGGLAAVFGIGFVGAIPGALIAAGIGAVLAVALATPIGDAVANAVSDGLKRGKGLISGVAGVLGLGGGSDDSSKPKPPPPPKYTKGQKADMGTGEREGAGGGSPDAPEGLLTPQLLDYQPKEYTTAERPSAYDRPAGPADPTYNPWAPAAVSLPNNGQEGAGGGSPTTPPAAVYGPPQPPTAPKQQTDDWERFAKAAGSILDPLKNLESLGKTVGGAWDGLKATFKDFPAMWRELSATASELWDRIKPLGDDLGKLGDSLGKLAQEIHLVDVLKGIGAAVLDLAATIGAGGAASLLDLLHLLIEAVQITVPAAFKILEAVITAFVIGPIHIILEGVTGFVTFFTDAFDPKKGISVAFENWKNNIATMLGDVVTGMKTFAIDVGSALGGLVTDVLTKLGLLDKVKSLIAEPFNAAMGFVGIAVNGIIDAVNAVLGFVGLDKLQRGHWTPPTINIGPTSVQGGATGTPYAGDPSAGITGPVSNVGTGDITGGIPAAAAGGVFGNATQVLVGEASTHAKPEVIINTNSPDKDRQMSLLALAASKLFGAGEQRRFADGGIGGPGEYSHLGRGWGDTELQLMLARGLAETAQTNAAGRNFGTANVALISPHLGPAGHFGLGGFISGAMDAAGGLTDAALGGLDALKGLGSDALKKARELLAKGGEAALSETLDALGVKDLFNKIPAPFKEMGPELFNLIKNGAVDAVKSLFDGITKSGKVGASSAGFGGVLANKDQVAQWIQAAADLDGITLTDADMASLLQLVQNESGGNTGAYNPTPVLGQHATGILQMLPSTFAAHMIPGHGDINNPIDNIASALRYILATYGSLQKPAANEAAGAPGYFMGTWGGGVPKTGTYQLEGGEMVIPANNGSVGHYIDLGNQTINALISIIAGAASGVVGAIEKLGEHFGMAGGLPSASLAGLGNISVPALDPTLLTSVAQAAGVGAAQVITGGDPYATGHGTTHGIGGGLGQNEPAVAVAVQQIGPPLANAIQQGIAKARSGGSDPETQLALSYLKNHPEAIAQIQGGATGQGHAGFAGGAPNPGLVALENYIAAHPEFLATLNTNGSKAGSNAQTGPLQLADEPLRKALADGTFAIGQLTDAVDDNTKKGVTATGANSDPAKNSASYYTSGPQTPLPGGGGSAYGSGGSVPGTHVDPNGVLVDNGVGGPGEYGKFDPHLGYGTFGFDPNSQYWANQNKYLPVDIRALGGQGISGSLKDLFGERGSVTYNQYNSPIPLNAYTVRRQQERSMAAQQAKATTRSM